MNTTFARSALALGIAVACAVIFGAAAFLTPRTAHADPGDRGGFDGYAPSDWDDVIAYLEAIAATEPAPQQEPAPAAVAPPPAAPIEAPAAPAPAIAGVPVATAAASPARVLLPNAGARDVGSRAPIVAATAAMIGTALIGAGVARRVRART